MSVDAAMKFIGELPNGHKVYWADDRFEQPGIHVWNGSTHDHYAIKPTPTDTADRIGYVNADPTPAEIVAADRREAIDRLGRLAGRIVANGEARISRLGACHELDAIASLIAVPDGMEK